jgi:ABC-type bacteriocin/lantibiotic exporter with double-glycine peptidase domain
MAVETIRAFRYPEIRWLGKQLMPLLPLNLLGLLSIVAASLLTLVDPLIVKWLIDVALVKRDCGMLLLGTVGFAVAYLGQLAFSLFAYLIGFVVSQKLIFRTRVALIRRLHLFSARYYENTPVGEILYRVQQDVDRVGELGGSVLPSLIRMSIIAIMVLITMAILNLRLTLMVLPLLPFVYFLQHRYLGRLRVAAESTQQQMGSTSSFIQEHLFGMLQLQLLNRTGTHGRKFARSLAAGAKVQTAQRVAEVRFSAASMSMIVLGSALILGYGGYDVIQNRLTVGGLVAFYSYVVQLSEPISVAVDLQSRLQRVGASIRRIVAILNDEEPTTSNGRPRQRLTRGSSADLEFSEVCFSYRRDRIVLDGVSFRVIRGEKIALVGTSGCGKSTIGHLATRLYSPDAGSVLIDGIDLQDVGQRNLRSIVTVVPQDPVLFNASMRENLLYGDPSATNRDLDEVIALAQLRDVVRKLPHGLDEPLGPMGRKLSGGEKKRVALARAFLQRPQILILDEVTSGLDGPTITSLLEALDIVRRATSIILISHKPSAMSWANRIVVLDQCKVLDQGNHAQLIDRCELYRGLYYGPSQESSDLVRIDALEPAVRSSQSETVFSKECQIGPFSNIPRQTRRSTDQKVDMDH